MNDLSSDEKGTPTTPGDDETTGEPEPAETKTDNAGALPSTVDVAGAVACTVALGCSVRSVDRAVRRLRREGLVESVPRYGASGAQLANAYRATAAGRGES